MAVPDGFWTANLEATKDRMNQNLLQPAAASTRPAASSSTKHMLFFATDTKQLSYDNGGAWVDIEFTAADITAGTLSVGRGGTGATSLAANGALIGNGSSAVTVVDMSTKGGLLVGDGGDNPRVLAVGGTANHVLTVDSTEPTGMKWAAPAGRKGVIWLNPHAVGGAAAHPNTASSGGGDYGVVTHSSTTTAGQVHFSGAIPSDFATLTKAVIVVICGQNGDMRHNTNTDFGASGEDRKANSESIAAATLADVVNELLEIDISSALGAIAALDYVGIEWNRDAAHAGDTITQVQIVGVLLEYT